MTSVHPTLPGQAEVSLQTDKLRSVSPNRAQTLEALALFRAGLQTSHSTSRIPRSLTEDPLLAPAGEWLGRAGVPLLCELRLSFDCFPPSYSSGDLSFIL